MQKFGAPFLIMVPALAGFASYSYFAVFLPALAVSKLGLAIFYGFAVREGFSWTKDLLCSPRNMLALRILSHSVRRPWQSDNNHSPWRSHLSLLPLTPQSSELNDLTSE